MTATTRTPTDKLADARTTTGQQGSIGAVVAGSLAVGLLAALLLVAAPFIPAGESEVIGAVLCGLGLGWAVVAVLSVRFTDQPQRWVMAPAMFLGVGGVLLLIFGSPVQAVLNWIWPPALLALVAWMIVRSRRQLQGRARRLLLYPVLAMLALASVGGGWETVSESADAQAYPMPGQLIDVGGHRLHLSCTGTGSPTVVLEPGAGGTSSDLGWIAPAVAHDTRVCVYDRAGRGWSEPADTPQDATQIATDLHTLLHRGNVPGPYVLAGHSFGGLYALTFAARYPDEVAGMVLVDSTAPAPPATPEPGAAPDAGSGDVMGGVSALVSTSARLGLGRLLALTDYASLPPRSRGEARAHAATSLQIRSTINEYIQGGPSVAEAASLHDLTDKPLIVLTAGSGGGAGWSEKQNVLAELSTNSAHRVVDGATHASMVSDQQHAAATTQAIVDVVSSVRTARPLAK
ncbi:MAG TPA: alpha/beta hydrolase [Nakamurella sp.]